MSLIVKFSEEQKERIVGLSRFGSPPEVISKALGVLTILDKSLMEDKKARSQSLLTKRLKRL